MNMALIEIAQSMIEALLYLMLFNGFLKMRTDSKKVHLVFAIGFVVIKCLVSLLPLPANMNLIRTICILLAFLLIAYENRLLKKLFVLAFAVVMLMVTDILVAIALGGLFEMQYETVPSDELTRIIGMVLTDFCKFSLIALAVRIWRNKQANLPVRYWVFIILSPVFSCAILYIIDYLLCMTRAETFYIIVLPALGFVYINFSVFNFFDTYANQLKLGIMEEMQLQTQENYRLLEANERRLRMMKHDMRNQLTVIAAEVKQNQTEALSRHLDSLYQSVMDMPSVVYTGDVVLDSILNIEGKKARQHGIAYHVKTVTMGRLEIEMVDLCAIFSNILDNAIEAAQKAERKEIFIDLKMRENQIAVIAKNTYFMPADQTVNPMRTTKKDKVNHGLGFKSVVAAVHKYNGHINYQNKDGWFIVNLLIDNTKPLR